MAANTKGKKSGGKTATAAEQKKREQQARQQLWALVVFAVGILVFFITLVQGQNVWHWFHNLFLGMFGWSAYLIAPLFIYIAVMAALDKPIGLVGHKVWQSMVLICLLSSATQIFGEGIPPVDGVFRKVGYLFSQATHLSGGGAVSALFGLPLLHWFGATGAKVTVVLLIFVFIMVLTGSTLLDLYRSAQKPVKKIEEVYVAHVEAKAAQPEKKRFNIDIPVDETVIPDRLLEEKQAPQPPSQAAAFPPKDGFHFHKAVERRQEEDQPAEELLPDEVSHNAQEETPAQETLPDPFIEDLISKVVQPPPELNPEQAFLETLKRQEQAMENVTSANLADDLVCPVTDVFDGKETLNRYQEEIEQPQALEEVPLEGASLEGAAGLLVEEPIQQEETGDFGEEEDEEEYTPPPIDLLNEAPPVNNANLQEELRVNADKLVNTLKSFGVQTRIIDIARGPAVTRYELQPSAGVKISKITNLADDIALNLAASGVRIEAPIPNKPAVGIEVPNKVVNTVSIREVLDSSEFPTAKSRLTVALGRDIAGQITLADLAKMPHTLIAGSTGSGKSVCINSLIISILYKAKPDEVKLLMVDPKMVELGIYNGVPHLLVPVVTDPKKAAGALAWAVNEMLNRYQMFKDNNVRDLGGFNRMAEEKGLKPMPQIVIIIDELADLMMVAPGEVEDSIGRLAQMARAAGMHLVIATQRPSVDVITGVIKANIPSRIAFAVSSQIDSRTILDASGAEKLLGRGDMLFYPVGAAKPLRVQGCFVTDGEVERTVEFIKQSQRKITYNEQIMEEIERQAVTDKKKKGGDSNDGGGFSDEDEMLPSAIECVVETGQASTSLLQRKLKLGYARAARIMDMMEEKGVIGPFEGSKPRQVLITKERWIEMKMISAQKAEDEKRNY